MRGRTEASSRPCCSSRSSAPCSPDSPTAGGASWRSARSRICGSNACSAARRAVRPTVELTPGELEAFTGVYDNGSSTASVGVGGSGLVVSFGGGDEAVEVTARSVGPALFEIVGGDYDRDSFDFPRPDLVRFGSVLVRRP